LLDALPTLRGNARRYQSGPGGGRFNWPLRLRVPGHDALDLTHALQQVRHNPCRVLNPLEEPGIYEGCAERVAEHRRHMGAMMLLVWGCRGDRVASLSPARLRAPSSCESASGSGLCKLSRKRIEPM